MTRLLSQEVTSPALNAVELKNAQTNLWSVFYYAELRSCVAVEMAYFWSLYVHVKQRWAFSLQYEPILSSGKALGWYADDVCSILPLRLSFRFRN